MSIEDDPKSYVLAPINQIVKDFERLLVDEVGIRVIVDAIRCRIIDNIIGPGDPNAIETEVLNDMQEVLHFTRPDAMHHEVAGLKSKPSDTLKYHWCS